MAGGASTASTTGLSAGSMTILVRVNSSSGMRRGRGRGDENVIFTGGKSAVARPSPLLPTDDREMVIGTKRDSQRLTAMGGQLNVSGNFVDGRDPDPVGGVGRVLAELIQGGEGYAACWDGTEP